MTAREYLNLMPRDTLLALMQREDPNGCWVDELAEAEGFEPLSHAEVVDELMDEDKGDRLAWVLGELRFLPAARI